MTDDPLDRFGIRPGIGQVGNRTAPEIVDHNVLDLLFPPTVSVLCSAS
jgi:hypothetical protein